MNPQPMLEKEWTMNNEHFIWWLFWKVNHLYFSSHQWVNKEMPTCLALNCLFCHYIVLTAITINLPDNFQRLWTNDAKFHTFFKMYELVFCRKIKFNIEPLTYLKLMIPISIRNYSFPPISLQWTFDLLHDSRISKRRTKK